MMALNIDVVMDVIMMRMLRDTFVSRMENTRAPCGWIGAKRRHPCAAIPLRADKRAARRRISAGPLEDDNNCR